MEVPEDIGGENGSLSEAAEDPEVGGVLRPDSVCWNIDQGS